MKIVITGANGFVGAALCRYFHDRGHTIIATGRQPFAGTALLSFATYVHADITKPLAPFDADVCIHAAALASDLADYESLFLTNVTGTANVLAAARNCRHFIQISSSSVYDFGTEPASETDSDTNSPISDYGLTKLLAEEIVAAGMGSSQRALILRPRAIYGVGDRILLARLLSLMKWGTIWYPGSATVRTSATHIHNLAYAIELFLNQDSGPALQVFNVADSDPYFLKELVSKLLCALSGRKLPVVKLPLPLVKVLANVAPERISPILLSTVSRNSVLDLSRIKHDLGYTPTLNFDTTMGEVVDWVNYMGGRRAYLNNLENAPWTLSNTSPGHPRYHK